MLRDGMSKDDRKMLLMHATLKAGVMLLDRHFDVVRYLVLCSLFRKRKIKRRKKQQRKYLCMTNQQLQEKRKVIKLKLAKSY